MDSIEESSAYDSVEILHACLCCISSLLNTLLDLSNGKGINDKYVEKINLLFSSLSQCDYTGNETMSSVNLILCQKLYFEKFSVINIYKIARKNKAEIMRSSPHVCIICRASNNNYLPFT